MSEKKIETASAYRWFCDLDTRWMDNDVYGHVNNVVYYSYFDTAANRYLIEHGGLDIAESDIIGVVVESKCMYYAPISYPEKIRAGVRVDKLSNRSVTYGIAVFRAGTGDAVASGHFVHVFVDRTTRLPVAIPEKIRSALAAIAT
ncbi:MAG: acyl-CoA thioesterase [Polyangiaceae bacterium]